MLSEEDRRRSTPALDAAVADLAPRPVVPKRLRGFVALLAVVSAVVVAVLGVVHHASSRPDGPDQAVTVALRSVWQPGPLAYGVDGLVALVPILLTVGVLAAASLVTGQRRLAVVALLAPFCVAAATTVVKPLVDRTINGANLSFPSGHAGYASSIGVVLGLLLVGFVRPTRVGWGAALLLVPPLVTGSVMAVDQVVIDAHYPSDTLGGFCTALAVVLTLALALDRVLDARSRPMR